jgi:hypothetical protein
MMKRLVQILFSVGVALTGGGTDAHAQLPPDSIRGALLELAARTPDPATSADQVNALATFTALEVSTAPIGTSTGAFAFSYDEQLGVFTRSTQSFGPTFADRSLTSGKGRLSVGLNWLHASYDSIAGMNLQNGEFLTARNAQTPLFPISHGVTYLDVSSDTVVGFAAFGVSDNVDVGVVVPYIRVSMGAELRLFNAQNVEVTTPLAMPKVDASGIGDMAMFAKYRFWTRGEGGLAGQVEVRFPTGDEEDLRGLGVTRTQVSAIWSQGGRIAPHATIGYEFWSDEIDITPRLGVVTRNQLRYAAGVEFQAHRRITAMVDVLGRRLLKGGRPGYERFPFLLPGGGSFEGLVGRAEGLNVVSLAPGLKWNVYRTLLLTGSVLTSLANDGLRAHVVPVLGLDWAF